MEEQTMSNNKRKYNNIPFPDAVNIIRRMSEQFPIAFSRPIRPLELGTGDRLKEAGFTDDEVGALWVWVGRLDYQKSIARGTRRIHLDGSDGDLPTEQAVEYARARVKAIQKKLKGKDAAIQANDKPTQTAHKDTSKPMRAKPSIKPLSAPLETPMETAMRSAFRRLDRPKLTLKGR